jgi:hypothetical protein
VAANTLLIGSLLRKDYRRPADSLRLEVHTHFDAVGNFDQRNSFVHPIVSTVEGHYPLSESHAA